jgi:hypothetical protein
MTVAAGCFAPGHLGELTTVAPFALVDAVLAETRCVQQPLRDLRRRLGAAPVRSLFEASQARWPIRRRRGARFGIYRTVSFDGCSSLRVPDSPRNQAWLGRTAHHGPT